jgi:hypothetical protein
LTFSEKLFGPIIPSTVGDGVGDDPERGVLVADAVAVPSGKGVGVAGDEGVLVVLLCVTGSGTVVIVAAVGGWTVAVGDVTTAVSIVDAVDGIGCEQLLSHTSDNNKNNRKS